MTRIAGFALALLLLAGCGARQVNLRTLAPDDLYARATKAYEAKDYAGAIPPLEAFVEQHLGDPRAPQALMYLGRAHEARKEYVSAATYYQRLAESFPSSPLNLDARLGICESYVKLSPAPQLDQEYTRGALEHCGSVSTNFPGTAQSTAAGKYVADLQEKLAQKSFQNAIFYQRRKAYDSAVIYFSEVVDSYPRSAVAPQALSRLLQVYGVLGYVEEAAAARERLLHDYPESPEAKALPPAPVTPPAAQ
jgi:outer membrane protein assembly factor BamD